MFKKLSLILIPLLVFIGCEGPEGPTGPRGDDGAMGPAGEVSEVIITVGTKNYTEANSGRVTVHYDNVETDINTVVIFASYKNSNDVWVNIERLGLYFSSTIYASSDEFSYDNKSGYAALIYDPDQELLGFEIKLLYIP